MAAEPSKPLHSIAMPSKARCAVALSGLVCAPNAVLHPMPAEGSQRQAWINFVRRCPDADMLAWTPPENERSYVCSQHFTSHCFANSVQVRVKGVDVMCKFLRTGAVPTQYTNATVSVKSTAEPAVTKNDPDDVMEKPASSSGSPVPAAKALVGPACTPKPSGIDLDVAVSASGHSIGGHVWNIAEQQGNQPQTSLFATVQDMKLPAHSARTATDVEQDSGLRCLAMPASPHCALPTCGRQQGPKTMLLPLPARGPQRHAWIDFVRRCPGANMRGWRPPEHEQTFVCSLHFVPLTRREACHGVEIIERAPKFGSVPTVYPKVDNVGGVKREAVSPGIGHGSLGIPTFGNAFESLVGMEQSAYSQGLLSEAVAEVAVQCSPSVTVANRSAWCTTKTMSRSTQACSLPRKVNKATQLGLPGDCCLPLPRAQQKRKKAPLDVSDESESSSEEERSPGDNTDSSAEEVSPSSQESGSAKNKFACGFCSRAFPSMHSLDSHVQTCVWPQPYPCCICTRRFTDLNSMRRHMASHVSKRPPQCPACSFKFSGKSMLLHLYSHLTMRPFKCGLCSCSFFKTQGLYYHLRHHVVEKPHLCHFCLSLFTSAKSLARHMRRHSGEKTHKCELCGDSFADNSALSLHMQQQHMGEKPYKCDVCSCAFADKRNHMAHMRVHMGKGPYKCGVCPRWASGTRHDLSKVIRRVFRGGIQRAEWGTVGDNS